MITGQQDQQQKNIKVTGTRSLVRKMKTKTQKVKAMIESVRTQEDLSQLVRFIDFGHSVDYFDWDEAHSLHQLAKTMESKFTDSEN